MKFIKENKEIIIIVAIITILKELLENTPLKKYMDLLFSGLAILLFIAAIVGIIYIWIKNKNHNNSSSNELIKLIYYNKKKYSSTLYFLTILLILAGIFMFISTDGILIPTKYEDIVFTVSLIIILLLILGIFVVLIKQSEFYNISKNTTQKDKLVKEYEQYILKETENIIKKNNKKDNIKIVVEIEYKENGKIIEKRKELSKDYESNLVLKIYQDNNYIETISYHLIMISNILKKSLFEAKITEKDLDMFLSEDLTVYFSEEYQYYNSIKELLKNIKYNKMDNIKYFMLIPEEINDSPYYKEYFNIIETEHTELKEFLDELGIDYKKPLQISCDQIESREEVYIEKRIRKEYIDLLEYNSIYRGTLEIPNNLIETKTKSGIQIGITYDEEDNCTLIYINFQKEMKRLK